MTYRELRERQQQEVNNFPFIWAFNDRVEFDKPCALQIDGETYLDVKFYSVSYH